MLCLLSHGNILEFYLLGLDCSFVYLPNQFEGEDRDRGEPQVSSLRLQRPSPATDCVPWVYISKFTEAFTCHCILLIYQLIVHCGSWIDLCVLILDRSLRVDLGSIFACFASFLGFIVPSITARDQ